MVDVQKQVGLTDKQIAVAGWENLPMLCLNTVLEHPYVLDLIKFDTLKWEFTGEKKKYKEEIDKEGFNYIGIK